VPPDPHAYEEKYGWNQQAAWTVALLVAVCLYCALIQVAPVWLRILQTCFFGCLALSVAVRVQSGRTAFRADSSGVAIGTWRSVRVCDWADVEQIQIRKQLWVECVWVHCRPGTAPVRRRRPLRPAARRFIQFLAPGSPAAIHAAAPDSLAVVAAYGWTLRPGRLAAAVAHYAPGVPVTDAADLPAADVGRPSRRGSLRPRLTGQQGILVRRVLWSYAVAISLVMLAMGAIYLWPDLRAAHGAGIHGSWVAEHCADTGAGDCRWTGEFVVPGGKMLLRAVSYAGRLPSVHTGSVIPALDTGTGGTVYPVTGSGSWKFDLISMIVGAMALLLLASGMTLAWRRWERQQPARTEAGTAGE
jgi:hypothetical protein